MVIRTSQVNTTIPVNGEVVLTTIGASGQFVRLWEWVVKVNDSVDCAMQIRRNGTNVFEGPSRVTPSFLFNQISGGTLLDGGDTSLKVVVYSTAALDFTIGWEPNFPAWMPAPVELVVTNANTSLTRTVKSWFVVARIHDMALRHSEGV